MTHPASRTRRRARDKRATPWRYRLTPAGRAMLAAHLAGLGPIEQQELVRANQAAYAQLRAFNNALVISNCLRQHQDKKP